MQPLYYTTLPLDRSEKFRTDTDWQKEQLQSGKALFLPVRNDQNLFFELDGFFKPSKIVPPDAFLQNDNEVLFLGVHHQNPVFCSDVSHFTEAESESLFPGSFLNLRKVIGSLSQEDASLLAYAKAMVHWHKNHRFCGKCGSETIIGKGGHERHCSNPSCKRVSYPRVDPAVIVLIEHQPVGGEPQCLLARNARFPAAMLSTLAGFCEPLESFEDTVRREMEEEVGLQVENIRYVASQPWPFPTSIMIGFTATALTTKLTIDQHEIEKAEWLTASAIRQQMKDGLLVLPNKDSIAFYLISQWLEKQGMGF